MSEIQFPRRDPTMSSHSRVEHVEDFTAHEWCNALLSDPTITHMSKRYVPGKMKGVTNTFLTKTLFTDGAIRAFVALFRPGKGQRRQPGQEVIIGTSPALYHVPALSNAHVEEKRQNAKLEKVFRADDPDTPEVLTLVSIGSDINGGEQRLHGGITATLLDQTMGSVVSQAFQHSCVTSDLNIKYKVPIMTPCVFLVRAKIVREKGRWIETKGWIEDGYGNVFAEGSGVFVLHKISQGKI